MLRMGIKTETEELKACPVCGAAKNHFLFKNTDRMHGIPGEFGLNQCLNCSLFYLSPRPTAQVLDIYYPKDYPSHQITDSRSNKKYIHRLRDLIRNTILYEIYHYKNYEKKLRLHPIILARIVSYLLFPLWNGARFGIPHALFPLYVQNGKALDIGCGTGHFVLTLEKLGYEAYGIEPSEYAARIGKENFGLNIKTGTLLDHKFPDNYFHLITMNHVLEHLYNPVETLKEIKRILHPGGIVLIRTPNMDSYGYKKFKNNWGPLETPRHLMLYSSKSLSTLAEITGLRVKSHLTLTANPSLFWSLEYQVRQRNGTDTSFGRTGIITSSQKLYINLLGLYEKYLVLLGKPYGEELQAVLVKR